jgi:hypothetical protein
VAAIYYTFVAPPSTGGDLVAMEHVAALDRMGFNARAFYCVPGDGHRQIAAPVALPGTPVKSDDVLVLGEMQREMLAFAGDMSCIRVLHNQAPYYTFFGFRNIAGLNAYPFAHVLVASDFAEQTLRALGVTHGIARVHPAVPDYFRPNAKTLQIAFSPAKRQAEALFLEQFFKARVPEYAHVPWAPLVNLSRSDCARALGASAIYAALPQWEGLGLMSLEAMAAGCQVVGYTGHGGAEYATPENGDWIADGDHEGFAARLGDACRRFEGGQDAARIAAARATAARYSREHFEADLERAWSAILGDTLSLYRNVNVKKD